MEVDWEVFNFRRIFLGDAPLIYLLEIVFRTLVMYGYTIILLRILGKRGMGQLSTLELAIIISFGDAVGSPMISPDRPIIHGMVAITVITFAQIGLERLINRNKKVETFLEGAPNLLVDNGIIKLDCLNKDNLSKEDLFRALRSKEVDHLGQINKAFFETSGEISVLFHSPKKVKPGLSILPENAVPAFNIIKEPIAVPDQGLYCCNNCGNTKHLEKDQPITKCELCYGNQWVKAEE